MARTVFDMNRRQFLTAGGAAVAAAGCSSLGETKPNILFFITDQQHIDTIGARGCTHVRTPAMDYLARRGASFAQSYCPDPVCSPSRSAIFTGRMPSETDVASNGRPIRKDIPNIGQWFSENTDYETIYAGKWHVPRTYQDTIAGFQVLPGGLGGQGNVGDTCVSRACEAFIRNRTETRPFLMVASFMQPHDICEWLRLNMNNPNELRFPEISDALPRLPNNFEYDVIEPELLRRRRQGNEPAKGQWSKQHWRYYLWSYYRHIEMVDGEVGRILQAIQDTGHEDDTVIVFTADHGEGLAHHQMVRKSTSYDEASKVPLLISWPGRFAADRNDLTSPVSGVDLVPTLCDCAGIRPPAGMVGRNLRPLLEGGLAPSDGYIVTEIPINAGRLVRTERYKFITYAGDPVEQLYDMENDPGETANLAGSSDHASVLADHKKLLTDWEARLDPAPKLPNADAWWRRA